jgi:hypothetical protein
MPQTLMPSDVQFALVEQRAYLRLTVSPQPPADGWSLLNLRTMCVVDGPGDAGFLLPRLSPSGDAAPAGWDEAVDRDGGALVSFGGAEPVFVPSAS